MSEIDKKKSSDAIRRRASGPGVEGSRGKPVQDHTTAAEQSREAQEAKEAAEGKGSIRDHMVDMGRGNQQSGRQDQ